MTTGSKKMLTYTSYLWYVRLNNLLYIGNTISATQFLVALPTFWRSQKAFWVNG
ncbi:hypothetical protein [Microcoleus sp. B3-A4]|uniref:hypothetical protein n=1 Tax=Microcoleus sp. B3-A4 TaxID=2818653 RepID=UPI002FD4B753